MSHKESASVKRLNDALQLPDYNALRAYGGPRKSVYVTGPGIAGVFARDDADNANVDNGGTVIVAANGKRWKRLHNGVASTQWFGMVADSNGTSGTDNTPMFAAMLADASIHTIIAAPGKYWFSKFAGDTVKFIVNRPLSIDWAGAQLFTGETSVTSEWSSTAFIRVLDVGQFRMMNYEFTDTTFSFANNSRGVQPVQILNTGTNVTYGYTLENFYVRAGQSLVTAGSTNPGVAIAKQIRFVGACRGGQVYYGANLAQSGDDFTGEYSLEAFNRSIFVYDVENVDAVIHAKSGQPSSANLYISAKGSRPTRNINVRATFDTLNGGLEIAALNTDPSVAFENVRLDLFIKGIGGNINTSFPAVRMGLRDTAGNWQAGGSYTAKNVSVKVRSLIKFLEYFSVQTFNTGVEKVEADTPRIIPFLGANRGVLFELPGGRFVMGGSGDLAANPIKFNLAKINLGGGPRDVFATLKVMSHTSSSAACIKEYRVTMALGSDGTHGTVNASLINSYQIGAYNPTITVNTDFATLNIGASAGGAANAATVVELRMDDAST